MEFSTDQLEYQPGTCNIGPKQQQKRLHGAIAGFVFTIIAFVLIVILDLPQYTRLLLFFPLFGAFVGLYQYTEKFCVAFAALAKYNMN